MGFSKTPRAIALIWVLAIAALLLPDWGRELRAQTLNPTAGLNFGNVFVGDTSPRTAATFSTAPDIGVTINSIAVTGSDFAIVTTTCPNPGGIGLGVSCGIEVAFSPSASGARAGTLTVNYSNVLACQAAPCSLSIPLNGVGVLSTVTVAAAPNMAEGSATAGVFTFSRTGSTKVPLVVNYTVGGTANSSDYTPALNGSVTIAVGQTNATVSITPVDDAIVEGPETVALTVASGVGYTVGAPSSASLAIADNDNTPPTITITATDPNASEVGSDPGRFTLTLSSPSPVTVPVTVNYTVSGTAANGSDYAALSGSVTFPALATAATVDVNPLSDANFAEGNETVILTLAAGANYTVGAPNSATVTISDQPPPEPVINITATDPNAAEQNREPGQFTITRGGSPDVAVVVNFTVAGTATAGADYAALSGRVNLASGQTSATLTVTPVDDALVEGPETVIVTLTGFGDKTSRQIIGPNNTATVTIADNDTPTGLPSVSITATDPNAAEENRNPGRFTVTRTGAMATPLTVAYTLSGTASNGVDYTRLDGNLTLPANAPSAEITVIPIDDDLTEGNEFVIATLATRPQYTVSSPSNARVTIVDNDGSSNNQPPLTSNDNAATQAGVAVTIDVLGNDSDPDGDPLTVVDARIVSPTGGTLTHTATTLTYTPPAGFSGLATLEYTVSDGVNTRTATVLVTVTAPRDELTLQQPNKVSEGAEVTISVNRASAGSRAKAGGPVAVDFATRDGSAKAGSDYVAVNGTLNWVAGDTQPKSFKVRINTDNEREGDEDFSVTLSNPTGGAVLGNPSIVTVVITNVERNFTGIPGLDPTQLAVAQALDRLCKTTASAALRAQCANLQNLNDNQVGEALRQIAPEEFAALGPTTLQTHHVQLSNIRERLTALRRGGQGVSLTGLTLNVQGEGFPIGRLGEGALKELSGGSAGAADVLGGGGRLGVFVNGRLDVGSHDRTGREAGYDFDTKGITLGADYRISDQFVVGGAFGYSDTGTDFDTSGGNLDAHGLTASLYGTFYTDNNLYIDAILGYGHSRYDTKRNLRYPGVNTSTHGDTDGNQWSASLTLGGDFNREAWLFSPYARLDYIRASIDGFRESGGLGLGLAIADQDITSLSSVLGTRVSRSISFNWGVLTPTASIEWEHEFKDGSRRLTSRFLEDPSVPFSITTDDPDRNYFNIGIGAAAVFPNGRSGFISYEGVFGQDDFETHTIQAGIRLEF
ncbi:MAG: autotransporter domain-containing protein [Gammaproteobacteria bacterium]